MLLRIIVNIRHTSAKHMSYNYRGTTILLTLESPKVVWEGDGLASLYYIRHIASNFNKKV